MNINLKQEGSDYRYSTAGGTTITVLYEEATDEWPLGGYYYKCKLVKGSSIELEDSVMTYDLHEQALDAVCSMLTKKYSQMVTWSID